MSKEERIIYTLGALALFAIVIGTIAKSYFPDGMPAIVDASYKVITNGPRNVNYLTYNQPYLFGPPVANLLPSQSSGMLGQSLPTSPMDYSGASNSDCALAGLKDFCRGPVIE